MRYGMSWPTGHGRREWVSMGCLGWLLLGPFIFAGYALYAAGCLVYVILRLLWLGAAGLANAIRRAVAQLWQQFTQVHPRTGPYKP